MQIQPIEALRKLTIEQLTELAKSANRLKERSDRATEKYKNSWPAVGKVVQAAAEYLESEKNRGGIARTTSLASYWKKLTGSDLNNHALMCSIAFDTYVKGGLIDEADYDKVTGQALETAAAISNAVGGELTHEALAQAAFELDDRAKHMQKKLQSILEKLNGRKPLKADKVMAYVQQAFSDGHHQVIIAACLAEMAHVKNPDIAEGFFTGMHDVVDAIEINQDDSGTRRFADDTLNTWFTNREKRKNHTVTVVTATEAEDEDIEAEETPAAKAA
jgi:2-polyprenyl-6-methoxyphenol hydroxylase-like FAD-dependent oxidoreductase